MSAMSRIVEKAVAVQFTGCRGAGSYRDWAKAQGYKHCIVIDHTSSAGDWSFFVSQDGKLWFPMFQSNNWPRSGFSRSIDTERPYHGTAEDVLQQISDEMEQEMHYQRWLDEQQNMAAILRNNKLRPTDTR